MKHCIVCGQDVQSFLPYKNGLASFHPILTQLQCIGSDVDNFSCPVCQSHDRERHLFLFMQMVPAIAARVRGGHVLHFAPERCFSILIQNQEPLQYIKANIQATDPSVVAMNIENITFDDNHFDLIIANHVLEHVVDDDKALSEITRTLKPGGFAILQTPFSALLPSSIAEVTLSSEVTRELLFGEPDHLRLYGLDIFSRFERHGLKFIGGGHEHFKVHIDSVRLGINPKEPFFLFEK